MDAASRTGIDDIREIIEGVRYAPASARYKVYIIDEVHMLSKQAFNGLLKTLEEPPPHVKFIFATTEIRKVPVTVLSRCQRFDLRRIEADVLIAHLADIAKKENVEIEELALASIARAAEGSVRDALSLLDQAIAHAASEGQGKITAESVRAMLGLADRGRMLDLFEKVMGGKIAEALGELKELYDRGADPLAVMQDLLETTHFLTRVKVAPAAEGFFEGGQRRSRARCGKWRPSFPCPRSPAPGRCCSRACSKCAMRAIRSPPAEMALIRLAYAADLPPTDKLVRELLDAETAQPAPRAPSTPSGGGTRMQSGSQTGPMTAALPAQEIAPRAAPRAAPSVELNSLEDIVALAAARGAAVLKVNLENDVHLVSLERGRMEFRPGMRARAHAGAGPRAEFARLDRRALDRVDGERRRRAHDCRSARERRARAPRKPWRARLSCARCWMLFRARKSSPCATRRRKRRRSNPIRIRIPIRPCPDRPQDPKSNA